MIQVISCGKLKEKWMREGVEEYKKRISSYDKIELIEVKDEKAPINNSEKDNEKVKEIEGDRILKRISEDAYVILLDLKGETHTSEHLTTFIENLYNQSKNKITFVIGGSLGVSQAVRQRANHLWKISDETFPHQLCRIIVLEQIYRCFKIMHHEPYHK